LTLDRLISKAYIDDNATEIRQMITVHEVDGEFWAYVGDKLVARMLSREAAYSRALAYV
jgi:hypothetical protein